MQLLVNLIALSVQMSKSAGCGSVWLLERRPGPGEKARFALARVPILSAGRGTLAAWHGKHQIGGVSAWLASQGDVSAPVLGCNNAVEAVVGQHLGDELARLPLVVVALHPSLYVLQDV